MPNSQLQPRVQLFAKQQKIVGLLLKKQLLICITVYSLDFKFFSFCYSNFQIEADPVTCLCTLFPCFVLAVCLQRIHSMYSCPTESRRSTTMAETYGMNTWLTYSWKVLAVLALASAQLQWLCLLTLGATSKTRHANKSLIAPRWSIPVSERDGDRLDFHVKIFFQVTIMCLTFNMQQPWEELNHLREVNGCFPLDFS